MGWILVTSELSLQILNVEVVDSREVFVPPLSRPGRSRLKVFLWLIYTTLAYSFGYLIPHCGKDQAYEILPPSIIGTRVENKTEH